MKINEFFSSNPPGLTEKLRNMHFFIAGAGGLGSNVALMLTRAGAVRFTIVDFDKVEAANINRQFYFRDQVGLIKVRALKTNLLRINPDIKINTIQEKITADNAHKIIPAESDIILECFDCGASKAMLATYCLQHLPKIPLITVSGLAGTGPLDQIYISKKPGKMIVIGDQSSEVSPETGTLSTRVMFTAAMQAHTAISILLKD